MASFYQCFALPLFIGYFVKVWIITSSRKFVVFFLSFDCLETSMPGHAKTFIKLFFVWSSFDSGRSLPYLCLGNQYFWQFNTANSLRLTFVKGKDYSYQ